MNKFVRISTSLLLSLFILVSGSGLIIGKMVCLKSGYVQISANEAKDCCDHGDNQSYFKDNCCAINNLSFEQQNFLGQDQQLLKAYNAASFISFPDFLSFSPAAVQYTSQDFSPSVPPDLVSGSAALPLLCVFRV